jgi:hypothetical protein
MSRTLVPRTRFQALPCTNKPWHREFNLLTIEEKRIGILVG